MRNGDVSPMSVSSPRKQMKPTVSNTSAAVDDQILQVLCSYLSPVNARVILRRSWREIGLRGRSSSEEHLPELIARIERAAATFLRSKAHGDLRRQLGQLCQRRDLKSETVAVNAEEDIVAARQKAHAMSAALGSRSVSCQKVATVVSELARNIALYTPGGHIELRPSTSPREIVVRAVDRGAGIPNLDEILSGNYRSKTGQGRGLLGTKRVADHFTIETGASGTRVEVRMRLF